MSEPLRSRKARTTALIVMLMLALIIATTGFIFIVSAILS